MFDDRERAAEAKFAHDEEMKFLAAARRDKLFARWAAERANLAGEAADTLARTLLAVRGYPKHEAALIQAAVAAAGIPEAEAAQALRRLGEEARQQLGLAPDM
jgi:hypothetical protein